MCDEKSPTVSLIEPLKDIIEKSMSPSEGDSATVASIKRTVLSNLSSRYSDEHHYLLEYSALDPRFRTLPHLEKAECQVVYHRLKEKAVQFYNQVLTQQFIYF